jgi:hypothetical protein
MTAAGRGRLDSTTPLSWGWYAVIYSINDGSWLDPTQASRLTGLPATTLRYWADEGVISRIHSDRGHHRRYLRQELEAIMRITCNAPKPTLPLLKWYINILTRR